MISDYYEPTASRPGIRLQRIELYNWGTFDSTDGSVYVAKIEGRTTLLVGRNGAGKSTLVDAVLTLLVPNSIRNYNVAAGAKKTERTERTYVLGACDQQLASDEAAVRKLYLRTGAQFYSIILAQFHDETANSGFTLAQVLYPKADGSIEKVFVIAEGDKSIAHDLHGLSKTDGLLATLKARGFKATKTFTEYHQWFVRRTHVKPLAMDVFNHTVAVKDIRSLNAFIREHMLENTHGKDRVQKLIDHFAELRAAHRQLVRIRTQHDLLTPIETHGNEYSRLQRELSEAEKLAFGAEAFFRHQTVAIGTPLLDALASEMSDKEQERDSVAAKIKQASHDARLLENEIDKVGGDRVRQIPQLIELESTHRKHKELRRSEFLTNAALLQLDSKAKTAVKDLQTQAAFAELSQAMTKRRAVIDGGTAAASGDRDQLVAERLQLQRQKRELENELDTLSRRKNNLPSSLTRLREQMCASLGIEESELPFAAELIAVDEDQLAWEPSIEMVLRGFAMSLLVPEQLYRRVSAYIDQNRLVDNGYGQKLVYQRVGNLSEKRESGERLSDQSLLRKLRFKDDHQLTSWLTRTIELRFNYRCCESIEEFHQTRSFAITRNRHLKAGESRHEKDDRDHASDPSRYVLGWNNQAKKLRLAKAIGELTPNIEDLNRRVEVVGDQLRALSSESNAIDRCLSVRSFADIDVTSHLRTIEDLKQELQQLVGANDKIGVLKNRLAKLEKQIEQFGRQRDDIISHLGELKQQITDGQRLVGNAAQKIAQMKAERTWDEAQSVFAKIAEELGEEVLSLENLFDLEKGFRSKQDRCISKLRESIEPIDQKLHHAMSEYLRKCPEDQDDLDASISALPSFLSKLQTIRREDLPRHEARFKERLNDTVSKEIGVFNSELLQEGRNIQSKIDELNVALRELPYNTGTFMRLEMRPVRNAEISEFKSSLRACLDDTFDNSPDANEARFIRMEKVIDRLSTDSTWRERVIDVRRWYDFGASEIDADSNQQRSYYEDSSGQSGGEKAKLAFTILVAAIAYQYDLDLTGHDNRGFHFVVVDEMFSKIDDRFAVYALKLFERFGLQLLIVAPLDAKARVTEPYVQHYLQVLKDERNYRSQLVNMSAREYEEVLAKAGHARDRDIAEAAGRRKSPK